VDLTWEKLVVVLFFVLPGFVGLHVYDMVVASRRRPPMEATLWSLVLSLAGAAVAGLWVPGRLLAQVLSPSSLSVDRWFGEGALLLSAVAVGGLSGLLVRRVLRGNLGDRSAYPTAWDALWIPHAQERRFIGVDTETGYFLGTLILANDGASGHDLVMGSPRAWDDSMRSYRRTGAEFSFFPGEQVRRVDLSVASRVPKSQDQGALDER
jgi:hypothetical protein